MNGFDFKGYVFWLRAALANPGQKVWKLVHHDAKSLIYMREPPPGVQALAPLDALSTLEEQCNCNVARACPYCARSRWGEMFTRIGDRTRARRWLNNYLATDPSGREITPPARAAERSRQIGGLHLAKPRP
jgi:hypothetical protein